MVSSTFTLCSQPTADVLSPRARMQDSGGVDSARSSTQMVMMAAKNSRVLFCDLTDSMNSGGDFPPPGFAGVNGIASHSCGAGIREYYMGGSPVR
jgi:hypothetical protein